MTNDLAPSGSVERRALLEMVAASPIRLNMDFAPLLEVALDAMGGRAATGFREALASLLLRSLETIVLAHPAVVGMSRYWDSYAGQHEEIVRQAVLEVLHAEAPPQFVEYIVLCAGGHYAQHGRKAPLPLKLFEDCLERLEIEGVHDLRCGLCGYHFQRADLGEERLLVAQELGFEFAAALYPGRSEDAWKPVVAGRERQVSLTRLCLDHVTPEIGFGWTAPDNVQVLCQFCNGGKLIYRRPTEAISQSIAGSLLGSMPRSEHSPLRQIIFVAALDHGRSRCDRCGELSGRRELTVVRRHEMTSKEASEDPLRFWGPAWNMSVQCYDCVGVW